ncbi:hypothetical protein TWF506_004580 [Arthrobotrys conoides]|uniref:Uncharacterized protein n=1 Tax=Arthrobotrys conoides TaxID=74498 RepID=A0AAN8RNY5_9PEZI
MSATSSHSSDGPEGPDLLLSHILEMFPNSSMKLLHSNHPLLDTLATLVFFHRFTLSEARFGPSSELNAVVSKPIGSIISDDEDGSLDFLFDNIRELIVQPLDSQQDGNVEGSDVEYIKLLGLFIRRIKNLKSLDYPLPTPLSASLTTLQSLTFTSHPTFTILDFLLALPSPPPLTSLTLKNSPPSLPFTTLPGIYLKSLESLTQTPFQPPQPLEDPSSSLSSKLTFIPSFFFPPKPAVAEETIYTYLLKNSIQPTTVRTFSQSPDLIRFLDYRQSPLSSYVGLINIEILLDPYKSKNTSEFLEFIESFWWRVPSHHRYTIKKIVFYPSSSVSSSSIARYKPKQIQKLRDKLLSSSAFDITNTLKSSIRKTHRLKHLELGGLAREGFVGLIEFVIIEIYINDLERVVWHFDGIDYDDEKKVDEKVVREIKAFVKVMRWKKHRGFDGGIKVRIVPGGEMRFVAEEGYWKLVPVSTSPNTIMATSV